MPMILFVIYVSTGGALVILGLRLGVMAAFERAGKLPKHRWSGRRVVMGICSVLVGLVMMATGDEVLAALAG